MSTAQANPNRRRFLEDIGSGMIVAGLGASLAADMGFSTAFAKEGTDRIDFGSLRSLVGVMQETPPNQLQPILVKKLKDGSTNLQQLVAAGALANAETFGGQDYVGFHTAMAFAPAYHMTKQLPEQRAALPVLKVLYRNSDQIQKEGGAKKVTLHPIESPKRPANTETGLAMRDAARQGHIDEADAIFAATADQSPEAMFEVLHHMVEDDMNVHRFVMAHRAYALIKLVGQEHAHTLLRQSVRLCAHHDQGRVARKQEDSPIRKVLPKLVDQYKLAGRQLGKRQVDDKWIEATCETIYGQGADRAAETVAAALAEGIDQEAVGEAISLAANKLVLCQPAAKGRTHGDSLGVHGSDAMNAWRNMARVLKGQSAMTGLIVAAYHTGMYGAYGSFKAPPYPLADHRKAVKATDAKGLLAETEDAIRHNDQGRAAAAIAVYTEQGHAVRPVFDLMLRYSISEDGRLHAEKYYHTVTEEYATMRPAFRSRQLVALARVVASGYGYNRDDKAGFRAPGYEEACRLLGVQA
jgi:hypothetical protein